MENIVIPQSLQITMDDVGWFNGEDDRKNGGSARTAMSRRHCAADYAAINELGRRLDMKINCAFVIGEWDDDNRLRGIKHLSKFGDGWNNAAYLGREEMEAVSDTVNASPYIDIAVHGLMHNYYKPDAPYSNTDYYYKNGGVWQMIPESEVCARLDAFFDMLEHHGINKNVNSFIPPSFRYIWGSMSHILKDYGIKYVTTIMKEPSIEYRNGAVSPGSIGIDNGVITFDRNFNGIPWYEISTNLDKAEPVNGIFGCHWPNILHEDPSRSGEIIDGWVRYFTRCADTFGTVLSRDMAFAATQSLYRKYAATEYWDGKFIIDVTEVPENDGAKDGFLVSAHTEIRNVDGCRLSVYEKKDGFINYEVVPLKSKIIIEL